MATNANDTLIHFASSPVAPGSSWKFLDNNTSLDAVAWKDSVYNDNTWNTGNSELGYGDGDENTVVNDGCTPQGSNCANKFITTYFRKTFFISNPSAYTSFLLQYKRDDGIEVFINGVRYVLDNLTDPVQHTSTATAAGDDGETVFSQSIPISAFYGNGRKNVIAVDIHQTLASSSDITFDLQLTGLTSAILTRGPYLQMGKQDSISIRWRTDVPTNSKVSWGNVFGTYPFSFQDMSLTTEHELRIGGLTADTKYYYTIGGTGFTLQADNTNYFLTAPAASPNRKLRFIALGDCGNASANQINVKNTYLNYAGSNHTDAMILLGDNAYSSGLDNEYQAEFFDIYKDDLLKNIKLYPAPGNHDYGNTPANAGVRNNAYYNSFSMPAAGQLGGVSSGTEAFYSFDIGNVHFISLDSYGKEDANTTRLYDTSGAQVTWLKNDLAANTKTWTIVYFHHPPYTKTSHNSDIEGELISIRENFIRILERYGVDMVLCGHSHGYERSYLLKGYYNNSASPLLDADFRKHLHTADSSSALYNGSLLSCPYTYNSGKINHGTVYVVAGSAGQLGGTTAGYPHDAMHYSNDTNGGLLYFEVDSNRLDAKFMSYNTAPIPVIRDNFTIFKDVKKITTFNVAQNSTVVLSASWHGSYYWPHNGGTGPSVTVPTNTIGTFTYIVTDGPAFNCLKDSFRVNVSIVLPALLTGFSAEKKNNMVLVNWITAQEQNTRHFIVERSGDGSRFYFFKTLSAAGFSNNTTQYSITDESPMPGNNYYRLLLVDADGRRTVLGVRKINCATGSGFFFSAVQQPGERVQITVYDKTSSAFSLAVFDLAGKKVSEHKLAATAGSCTETLALNRGFYIIRVSNSNGEVISGRICSL